MIIFALENKEDELKFIDLYNTYKKLMYVVAYEILRDNYLSEDAVHQSFVKIINNMHKIATVKCPHTKNFLIIICKNTAKTIKNKISHQIDFEDETCDVEIANNHMYTEPSEILITNESVKDVAISIENLKTIYRDVILLQYNYEYSYRELSDILDISEETVRKRLMRAKQMIREELKRKGYNE